MPNPDTPDWLGAVDTSPTPKAKDILYSNTNESLAVGVNRLGGASNWIDVATYQGILATIYPNGFSLNFEAEWSDVAGTGRSFAQGWDIFSVGFLYETQRTLGRYLRPALWTATAHSGVYVVIYGLQSAGVNSGLDFPHVLSQASNQNIAAAATYTTQLTMTWAGMVRLFVFAAVNVGMTVTLRAYDYTNTQLSIPFRYDTTGAPARDLDNIERFIALPPHYHRLDITNNDAVARGFYWSLNTSP